MLPIRHLLLLLILLSCVIGTDAVAAGQASLPAVDASLYATEPAPWLPAECGRCHPGQFGSLRQEGGKHRFDCQACHRVFHAYDPRKNNYAAIMPQCAQCHSLPHGATVTDCLGCHSNPHAPRNVPVDERLIQACASCHAGPAEDLAAAPSQHTELGCKGCHHQRHGYIPNCFECHAGHVPEQQVQSCAECHQQVHKPLQIALSDNTDTGTCGVCHDSVYSRWRQTPSRHGQVNCGTCHQQHTWIPDCRSCHAEPHDPRQLAKFPDCLTCHIDVHDLPVKQ